MTPLVPMKETAVNCTALLALGLALNAFAFYVAVLLGNHSSLILTLAALGAGAAGTGLLVFGVLIPSWRAAVASDRADAARRFK